MVGTWLENQSGDGNYLLGIDTYRPDGTFSAWMALVTKTDNVLMSYDGQYTVSGNVMTVNYVSPLTGLSTQEKYEVRSLDDYKLVRYYAANSSTAESHKVVDTFDMKVGDERTISLADANIQPTAFTSLTPGVATVDGSGKVTAKKRGLTFVTVQSPSGDVVVRVDVSDPDNVIDDIFAFMGEDISRVENVYGTNYVEAGSPLVERFYNVLDMQVEKLTFGYSSGVVLTASAKLRREADIQAIAESYVRKFGQKQNGSDAMDMYLPEKDGQKYLVTLDKSDYSVTIIKYVETKPAGEFGDENFLPYEGLMNLSAEQAAQKLGYTLTDENLSDGFFSVTPAADNKVFRRVQFIFDEEEEDHPMTSIVLTCKTNITQAQVEPWYAARYTATGDDLNQYHNDQENYYICLRETKTGVATSTTIYYSKRKRNR